MPNQILFASNDPEFSRVLHLRQNVINITRAEQHGASGLIATHARFFDAGSHGGGPEIPHKAECEKFGPSFAYWPPKRATRAYSRYLVYQLPHGQNNARWDHRPLKELDIMPLH